MSNLPPWGIGGAVLIALWTIQTEVRFGRRARAIAAGSADRGSTLVVTLSSLVSVFGFVFAMKARVHPGYPAWLGAAGAMPGMPAVAWAGVASGGAGLLLRLWAVLRLRERFTRTLLVHEDHAIERGGPYRFVRHPGYLGSLLCLNGVALASGNAVVFAASLVATLSAYGYRVRREDAMLVGAFGEAYEAYRREVGALLPFVR
jgi:protein-S-isoprenylcysteine O-methyltransferase Ste14